MGSTALPEEQCSQPFLAGSEDPGPQIGQDGDSVSLEPQAGGLDLPPAVPDVVADAALEEVEEKLAGLAVAEVEAPPPQVAQVPALPDGAVEEMLPVDAEDGFFDSLGAGDGVGEGIGVNSGVDGAEVGILSDAQLDAEVESFLGPEGGAGVVEDAAAAGEAQWSDFKFSQVGSFSDFLSELGDGARDSADPFGLGASSSVVLGGVAAADANGSVTLGQHLADGGTAGLDVVPSATVYWETSSTQKLVVDTGREQLVYHEQHLSQNGFVETAAEETFFQDLAQAALHGNVVESGAAVERGDAGTTVSPQQGDEFGFVDPQRYYEDPQYPGWLYCLQTGQWITKPVHQNEQEHGSVTASQHAGVSAPEVSDAGVQQLELESSKGEVNGQLQSVETSDIFGRDSWEGHPKEGLAVADWSNTGPLADWNNAVSPDEAARTSAVQEVPATSASSEATTSEGGYVQEGRGYDPAYPGWYYDYQSQSWCVDDSLQGPRSTEVGSSSATAGQTVGSASNPTGPGTTSADNGHLNQGTQTYAASIENPESNFDIYGRQPLGTLSQAGPTETHGHAVVEEQYSAVNQAYLGRNQQSVPPGQPEILHTGSQAQFGTHSFANYDHQGGYLPGSHAPKHMYPAGSPDQLGRTDMAADRDYQGPQQTASSIPQFHQGLGRAYPLHGQEQQGLPHRTELTTMQDQRKQQQTLLSSSPVQQGHFNSYSSATQGQQVHNYVYSQYPAAVQGPQTHYQSADVAGSSYYNTPSADRQANMPISYSQVQSHVWSHGQSLAAVYNNAGEHQYGGSSSTQNMHPMFNPGYPESTWNSGGFTQQPFFPSQGQQVQLQPGYNPQSGGYNYGQPWAGDGGQHPFQHPHSWAPSVTPPRTAAEAVRSTAGRPPHALSAFGFGGRIALMKLRDPLSLQTSDGEQSTSSGQAWMPSAIKLLSLSQLVAPAGGDGLRAAGSLYFESLSRRAYNGPLVNGGVSTKDVIKWIDERAKNCQTEEPCCKDHRSLSELWALLKIMCQHHGKLRSAIGATGTTIQDAEGPEIAVASLLTSEDESSMNVGSLALQTMPSEQELQKTANEVKTLLTAGKRMDALRLAKEGQLWGPALVLARQLGDKFYGDTVIAMSRRLLVPESPLRTLCLLLAGQAAEVVSSSSGSATGHQIPGPGTGDMAQTGIAGMIEEWRSNLAIMAANRVNGDERVITSLGDRLWATRRKVYGYRDELSGGQFEAAHICYLAAELNFEAFSHNARLCLLGANHIENSRTYVSPEAIQRTELYEYAKVLGNPQFFLPQFQPYKLVYAAMLVEAGNMGEALRYCQAVLKMLKTAGRSPEVEVCRQAATSLEERIKGYTNGRSGSGVPKLFRSIFHTVDKGISGIIGGAPPPMNSDQYASLGMANGNKSLVPGSSSRPSTSTVIPSASMDSLDGFVNNAERVNRPPRSVSVPDFSKSPNTQEASEQPSAPSKAQEVNGSPGSVFSRFSATFLQKAGFFVGKTKNEAKLGERNKFYFDTTLNRWVEEGAPPPPEEAVLAPPPTAAKFVTPAAENSVSSAPGTSGTPPVPPGGNQFSARTRQGYPRSRYVDTFSKGGAPSPQKSALSPLVPPGRPSVPTPQAMNFFVPSALATPSLDATSNEQDAGYANAESIGTNGQPKGSQSPYYGGYDLSASPQPNSLDRRSNNPSVALTPPAIHRVASVDNAVGFSGLTSAEEEGNRVDNARSRAGSFGLPNGSHARAASWGGSPSFETIFSNSPSSALNASGGYLKEGAMLSVNTSSSGAPYYLSPPPKMEAVPLTTSHGFPNVALPLPPSLEAPRAPPQLNSLPLLHLGSSQNGELAGGSLAAEEMQEVEL